SKADQAHGVNLFRRRRNRCLCSCPVHISPKIRFARSTISTGTSDRSRLAVECPAKRDWELQGRFCLVPALLSWSSTERLFGVAMSGKGSLPLEEGPFQDGLLPPGRDAQARRRRRDRFVAGGFTIAAHVLLLGILLWPRSASQSAPPEESQ